MKPFTLFLMALAASLAVSCACNEAGNTSVNDYESLTVEQILEEMRRDTVWIRKLDSLAQIQIGPGAKCLDAVKHTFLWSDRLWVYNQDWGGVLEIPEGYVPSDDELQAHFSYHGSEVFSSDSLVYISHYAGCQSFTYEEYLGFIRDSFAEDSLIIAISQKEDTVSFPSGDRYPIVVVMTENVDGIKGYYRYIYSSPEDVEYCVSVQYLAEMEEQMGTVREMVDRYPFGPAYK